jgi:hypothetical protein
MVTKKTAVKKVAVKKAHAQKPAVKRTTRTISTVPITLPEGTQTYRQAMDFIHANQMPPFGTLSKKVDAQNAKLADEVSEHFSTYPDPDKRGLYAFNREFIFQGKGVDPLEEVVVLQSVLGYADTAFVLKTDTARRGARNVQFFSGAHSAAERHMKKAVAHGMATEQAAEEAQAAPAVKLKSLTIPNAFHRPWAEVLESLEPHVTDVTTHATIRTLARGIAEHAVNWGKSVDDALTMLDCVVQTRVGLTANEVGKVQGFVDIQFFQGARAGAVPLGVIHLTTERTDGEPERVVGVTKEVMARAPEGYGRNSPLDVYRHEEEQRRRGVFGQGYVPPGDHRYGAAPSLTSPSFGMVQGPVSFGGRQHGMYGAPANLPEQAVFSTNSLERLLAYAESVATGELSGPQKFQAEQALATIGMQFRSAPAGALTYVFEYMPGRMFSIYVRDMQGYVLFQTPISLNY